MRISESLLDITSASRSLTTATGGNSGSTARFCRAAGGSGSTLSSRERLTALTRGGFWFRRDFWIWFASLR